MPQPLLFPAEDLPRADPPEGADGGLRGCLGHLVECGYPLEAALALWRAYPGCTIKPPRRYREGHPLLAALGDEWAEHLSKLAAGVPLRIPRQPYRRDHLAALIRADIDAGLHRHTIATKYSVTERLVEKISGSP